jgi:hypothetical protein
MLCDLTRIGDSLTGFAVGIVVGTLWPLALLWYRL